METLKNTLGPDDEETLRCLHLLAHAYGQVGRAAEAFALHEQLLAKQKAVPGPDTTVGLEYMTCLAEDYQEAGRFDRAEPLLVDSLAQCRKDGRPLPVETVALEIGLVRNLFKQHRYAEAETLLRELLRSREQYEADGWTTFNTRSMLGGGLLGQKKYAEAEPLLLAGYEGMKQREEKIPPGGNVRMTEAIDQLVQLYEAWGQPERAAMWRAKLPPAAAELPADVFARP